MEPITFADLIRLTVAIVLFDADDLRAFGKQFARIGHAQAFHETALQCHLFCGIPRTLSALDILADAGMKLSEKDVQPGTPEEGAQLFDRIYGDGADKVREHLESLSPSFAAFIRDHAYGAVLSRGELGAGARELLAVAALAVTGHERQLASHVRGAVRCGARIEDVRMTIDEVAPRLDADALERVRAIVERFGA